MIDIPCIIFAGGKSSRMGEDKALLPFGDFTTLTEFQYARLSEIFSSVYISCKDKSKFNFDAHFIEDSKERDVFAPTAGFISAFKELSSDKIFVMSVDSPFINEEIISQLLNADDVSYDAVIAKTQNGMQPLCGIYHCSLEEKFSDMLKEQNHRLGLLLQKSKTHYVYFKDETQFLNLNHPFEYEKALKLLNINTSSL